MALHFKNGVDLRNLTPQTTLALVVASECFTEEGEDCTVTSLYRPGLAHVVGLHGAGNAVDLSVKRLNGTPIPVEKIVRIIHQLNLRLGRPGGGQFDVVDELPSASSTYWTGPHIHLEFDPK
jgi:hypothetical protein